MRFHLLAPVSLALALGLAAAVSAAPLGTAITYQGRIDRSNSPASDTFSMIFKLYDAASAGAQVGPTLTVNGVATTNGLFSVTLDFGAGMFTSQARWLDVQVKGSADAAYTLLTPRQPITAAPVALYALNGGTGGSQWTSDGPDLSYSAGAVGVTGASTPFASGKGLFLEGGNTSFASVFAYNYDTFTPLSLSLNGPGGNVGIGTTTPAVKLDVKATANGIQSKTTGSIFNTQYNAAMVALGYTGNVVTGGAPCMGLYSASEDERGVWGISTTSYGVAANCINSGNYAIMAGPTEGMAAWSTNVAWPAGRFTAPTNGVAIEANGIAKVKTLQITGGADLAERFESDRDAEPGTVMVIDPAAAGHLRVADTPYARTVAGVVSGANGLAAGVELAKDEHRDGTVALALTGRVWVKCDAGDAPIRPGDLLTTSARAGHAMRVADSARAQGAILGKAMTSLEHGTGLVLVLVSLQ